MIYFQLHNNYQHVHLAVGTIEEHEEFSQDGRKVRQQVGRSAHKLSIPLKIEGGSCPKVVIQQLFAPLNQVCSIYIDQGSAQI